MNYFDFGSSLFISHFYYERLISRVAKINCQNATDWEQVFLQKQFYVELFAQMAADDGFLNLFGIH